MSPDARWVERIKIRDEIDTLSQRIEQAWCDRDLPALILWTDRLRAAKERHEFYR